MGDLAITDTNIEVDSIALLGDRVLVELSELASETCASSYTGALMPPDEKTQIRNQLRELNKLREENTNLRGQIATLEVQLEIAGGAPITHIHPPITVDDTAVTEPFHLEPLSMTEPEPGALPEPEH